LTELPIFLGCWIIGLSIILLPNMIVQLFGKEIEEDEE
jgi:hypothetical protein